MTKALGTPNENPNDPAGVDLARIGFGAPPMPPLTGTAPGPSGPGKAGGEGYIFFLFSVSALSLSYSSFADFFLLFQGLLTAR